MRIRACLVTLITVVAVGCNDDEAVGPDATVTYDAPDIDVPGADATDGAGPDGGPPAVVLDPAFGTGGWTAFDGHFMDVARQPDGRIVLAAYEPPVPPATVGTPVVLRYLANGSLDPAFGQGGVARDPAIRVAWSVAVLTDGRIVVGGGGVGGLVVLSSAGAVLATRDVTGNAKDVLAMADGGFVAGIETAQMVMLGTVFGVSAGRWDSALARVASFGTAGTTVVEPPQSFGTMKQIRLARLTSGGVERVVVTYNAGVRGVVAATGALDGSFSTTAGGATDVVPIAVQNDRVVVGQRRLAPGIDTTELLPVASSGAGAPTAVSYCSFTTDTRPVGIAIDSAGRAIVAPIGDTTPTVRMARLVPTLAGPDPAWGCGRTFTLPAYCPTGLPCPGDSAMDGMRVLDLIATSGDATLVAGNQVRTGTSRGFLARVLP